jgi:hypothetical protein
MNDHGDAVDHAFENHMRNAISLPRRPLYHVMIAGKNNGGKDWNEERTVNPRLRSGKKKGAGVLQSQYMDFGAGIMQFQPGFGINPLAATGAKGWSISDLYISWHPGAHGHRVYDEILAYEYLDALLKVLQDIQPLIKELGGGEADEPIEEMLEMLEDPPRNAMYLSEKGIGGGCEPLCTNASNTFCLSGYQPLANDNYMIAKWVMDEQVLDSWKYALNSGNSQALWYGTGGQARPMI